MPWKLSCLLSTKGGLLGKKGVVRPAGKRGGRRGARRIALGRPQAPDHSTGRPAAPKTPPAPPPRRGQGLSSSSGFPARGSGLPDLRASTPCGRGDVRTGCHPQRVHSPGGPRGAGGKLPHLAQRKRAVSRTARCPPEGAVQGCVLSLPGGGSPEHPPGLGTGHMEPRVT